jgi:hypothetical protein
LIRDGLRNVDVHVEAHRHQRAPLTRIR